MENIIIPAKDYDDVQDSVVMIIVGQIENAQREKKKSNDWEIRQKKNIEIAAYMKLFEFFSKVKFEQRPKRA